MRGSWLALAGILLVLPLPARGDVARRAYALPTDGGYPHDVAVGARRHRVVHRAA